MAETRQIFDPFDNKTVTIRNDLILRLRGRYATGPTLENGEPEFGWREFPTPPIQHEAAAEIERLRADRETYNVWADEIKLNIDRLQTFIEFVLLWLTRDKVTDEERVSVIKHHPFLQDIIKERLISSGNGTP